MNLVILKGRLTKDPEVRMTQTGKNVAAFTVATDRRGSKNSNGPTADFHNCIAWDKTAELIGKYFAKGKEILLNGHIQTRSYDDKNGQKRYVTEVMVDSVEFCGSKSDGQSCNNGGYGNSFGNGGFTSSFKDSGPSDGYEDVPF